MPVHKARDYTFLFPADWLNSWLQYNVTAYIFNADLFETQVHCIHLQIYQQTASVINTELDYSIYCENRVFHAVFLSGDIGSEGKVLNMSKGNIVQFCQNYLVLS